MSQEKEWESIWKERRSPLKKMVDLGREVYNLFFRRILKKYLNKDSEMVELGCGTATLGLSLCQDITSYTGIDISKNALLISKNNAKMQGISNAEFLIDDCTDLKIKKKFDVVWSQGLIEHFEKPIDIVKEHLKVTKKNGYSVISVPYKFSYMIIWYWITRPRLLRRFWPWTEQIFFSGKDLKKIGIEIGKPFKVKLIQPFILGVILLVIKNE
ncbi:hypothetical protein C0585_07485 [Candidatus Woesearchaeota archaeon]|nr:MAG: hypothetical protein C0585_07485 [Candidatus Woesearchaeota archaeon]